MSHELIDVFAAHALVGLLSCSHDPAASGALIADDDETSLVAEARSGGWDAAIDKLTREGGQPFTYASFLADEAYTIAEAMLAERQRLFTALRQRQRQWEAERFGDRPDGGSGRTDGERTA